MKSTILNLKERVLVMEGDVFEIPEYTQMWLEYKIKMICKGSELTEEILKNIIEPKRISSSEGEIFPDFKNKGWLYGKPNRMRSFISAIEANQMFWKNHNVPVPYSTSKGFDEWDENGKIYEDVLKYQDAKKRTFHPDITLLFEIL